MAYGQTLYIHLPRPIITFKHIGSEGYNVAKEIQYKDKILQNYEINL